MDDKHIYQDIHSAVLSLIRIFGPCNMTTIMREMKELRGMGKVPMMTRSSVRMEIESLIQCGLIREASYGINSQSDCWEDANANVVQQMEGH